jgi:hypothetical protein
MLPTLGRMWTQDFLVIDSQSYASYSGPKVEEGPLPPPFGPDFGSMGGFVRLVDTVKPPQDLIDATSPGYKGEMKVLSSLLLEELYPLLASKAIRPFSLWPLARLHMKEVYVGHTVNSQEAWWNWNKIDTSSMLQMFFQDMRKKKAQLGEDE